MRRLAFVVTDCDTTEGQKVALDAAGRVVVPKALRQVLGLKPGQPLEIRAANGRLKKRGKGVVAVPDTDLPQLTAEQVRDTLERVRRGNRRCTAAPKPSTLSAACHSQPGTP